jgi:hypothetical protein
MLGTNDIFVTVNAVISSYIDNGTLHIAHSGKCADGLADQQK